MPLILGAFFMSRIFVVYLHIISKQFSVIAENFQDNLLCFRSYGLMLYWQHKFQIAKTERLFNLIEI